MFTDVVEEEVLVLDARVGLHGRVVGRKHGRLPEFEQRRNQFIPRNQIEKLETTKQKVNNRLGNIFFFTPFYEWIYDILLLLLRIKTKTDEKKKKLFLSGLREENFFPPFLTFVTRIACSTLLS